MKYKITEIMRIDGTGHKILNHLLKSSILKKNYIKKNYREINYTYVSGIENIKRLIELGLITMEKVGKKKYLKITKKGKKVVEELYNLQRRLENK